MSTTHTQPVSQSSEAYWMVKKLISRLSLSEREQLKREIDSSNKAATDQNSRNLVHNHLTKRECQVLTLIATGFTRKEVACTLNITENTASCHVSRIYGKLQISTIAEATHEAMRLGVLNK